MTPKEKEYLYKLVKKELEQFKESKKIIIDMDPAFFAGEEKYEDFLENLLKKLK